MRFNAPKWGDMRIEEKQKVERAMKRVWNPPKKKRFKVYL